MPRRPSFLEITFSITQVWPHCPLTMALFDSEYFANLLRSEFPNMAHMFNSSGSLGITRPSGYPAPVKGTHPIGPLVKKCLIYQATVFSLNLGLKGIVFIHNLPQF